MPIDMEVEIATINIVDVPSGIIGMSADGGGSLSQNQCTLQIIFMNQIMCFAWAFFF